MANTNVSVTSADLGIIGGGIGGPIAGMTIKQLLFNNGVLERVNVPDSILGMQIGAGAGGGVVIGGVNGDTVTFLVQ